MIADFKTLQYDIDRLQPWFHNLHLPGGLQTAPNHCLGDFPRYKWATIAQYLPDRLDAWRVLDIGCNGGFYSIELARRGAIVDAIDCDPHYLRQAEWAMHLFHVHDRVRLRQMQVYELVYEEQMYDLVLFMGVFYHLRYPLLALDLVARLVRQDLIFQSLSIPGEEVCNVPPDVPIDQRHQLCHPGWPHMAFIENSLAGDPTNWWAPNHAACEAMLRSAGLNPYKRIENEVYLCRPDGRSLLDRNPGNPAEWAYATGRRRTHHDLGDFSDDK